MSITVQSPGLQTTVQDLGRTGYRHLGVAAGGVLDPVALQAGNALLGNAPGAAALEFALLGPTLRAEADLLVVLLATESATLDGVPVAAGQPLCWPAGATLRLGPLTRGARGWLCVAGGVSVPEVLGSRSTDLVAGFGGLDGRALRAGDRVPVGEPAAAARGLLRALTPSGRRVAPWGLPPARDRCGPIRVLMAAEAGAAALPAESWTVAADSNRMGVRLQGAALPVEAGGSRLSAGVAPGVIQLPPSGQPIVLLADAQTVGGYPWLGAVIGADLPRLAQARPGGTLRFRAVSLAEAEAAAREQAAGLARLELAAAARLAAYS
jgi:biotin-dependent carboxylase-like uncharacterized protein